MLKKVLFVFLLAAAVVAFAGYSVPTASACSATTGIDNCTLTVRFDPDTSFASMTQTVASPAATTTSPSSDNGYLGIWNQVVRFAQDGYSTIAVSPN